MGEWVDNEEACAKLGGRGIGRSTWGEESVIATTKRIGALKSAYPEEEGEKEKECDTVFAAHVGKWARLTPIFYHLQ